IKPARASHGCRNRRGPAAISHLRHPSPGFICAANRKTRLHPLACAPNRAMRSRGIRMRCRRQADRVGQESMNMNMIPASKAMASASAVADQNEIYTRIGDMAAEFGVTLRALRFYEDKGLIQPKREGTTRLYTHRDKTRLKLILLGRRVGFSLRDIKQIMDLYDPAGANTRQYKVVLDKSQRQLARLEKQRAAIADAIAELTQLAADVRAQMEARGGTAKQ